MPQTRERGRSRRGSRAGAAFEVREITSRYDMADMLARKGRLFRDYARSYLGPDASNDDVEDVVEAFSEKALAIEEPRMVHGLEWSRKAIKAECEEWLRRRELSLNPVDEELGALVGLVKRVVDRLGPRTRRTIIQVASGVPKEEIAEQESVTVAAVNRRLERGRARGAKLLEEMGHRVTAFVVVLPWRIRGPLVRLAHSVAHDALPQSLAATMLVPLLASGALDFGGLEVPPGPSGVVALAPSAAATFGTPAPSTPSTVRIGLPLPGSPKPSPVHRASTSAATHLRGAAAETPDDVILGAMATPSDGRPIILAEGHGNTCNCPVLMESDDGGASWVATDGPPADVNQLAIPPTYPRDPRIFAGVDRHLGSSPYRSAAFGQPFARLTTLPPGPVAVSAHFDDGDPRLFSAAATAVWSIDLPGDVAAAPPRDEVDYSSAAGTTSAFAALATPAPSPDGPSLLIWAPPQSVVAGSPGVPLQDSSVLTCDPAMACTTVSSLPLPLPWRLGVAGSGGTVVAYSRSQVYLSHDSGHTFSTVSLPSGGAVISSMTLVGADATPWGSFILGNGLRHVVARFVPGTSEWLDTAGTAEILRTRPGSLVAVGSDRVIVAFADAGYRCTRFSGAATWAARCPA